MRKYKKKNPIKRFTLKDERAFEAFSNCGYVTKGQLIDNIPQMSNKRIDNYVKMGLIEKEVITRKDIGEIEGYKLTRHGIYFINDYLGIEKNYVPQNPYHDYYLSEKYFEISKPYYEAETVIHSKEYWKNETILKAELKDMVEDDYRYKTQYDNGEISCTDGSYITYENYINGTMEYETIEIETNYYGDREISAKTAFCQIMEIQYNSVRV